MVQRLERLLRLHAEQVADPAPSPAKLIPDLGVVGEPPSGQLQNRKHPLAPALGLDVQRRGVADRGENRVGRDHQTLPGRQSPIQRTGPKRVRPHQGVECDPRALVEPGLEDPVEGEGEARIEVRGALEEPPRRIPLGPAEILLPLQVRLERRE